LNRRRMDCFAGIDVGSLFTKVVIIDQSDRVTASSIHPTGVDCKNAVDQSLALALTQAKHSQDQLAFIVATGYGRAAIPYAHKQITEISCHAQGAHHLFPDTGMVIDIGGQDSKVIRVGPEGKVLDFSMNDKCAAGTGRFLEVMAATFQIPIKDFGQLSLQAKREIPISSVCTVFAESEVISLIAQNEHIEDIARGIHRAIVNRIWNMVQTVGIHDAVTMTGGVAQNRGIVSLIEEKVGKPINIHTEPQMVGALGAALLARRHFLKGKSIT
jgi:predicted CoA-substrate-specific enzyme activase